MDEAEVKARQTISSAAAKLWHIWKDSHRNEPASLWAYKMERLFEDELTTQRLKINKPIIEDELASVNRSAYSRSANKSVKREVSRSPYRGLNIKEEKDGIFDRLFVGKRGTYEDSEFLSNSRSNNSVGKVTFISEIIEDSTVSLGALAEQQLENQPISKSFFKSKTISALQAKIQSSTFTGLELLEYLKVSTGIETLMKTKKLSLKEAINIGHEVDPNRKKGAFYQTMVNCVDGELIGEAISNQMLDSQNKASILAASILASRKTTVRLCLEGILVKKPDTYTRTTRMTGIKSKMTTPLQTSMKSPRNKSKK